MKSNTARALRRAPRTDEERDRIRRRVFAVLRAGHVPHEFREYAKRVRSIGFDATDVGTDPGTSDRVSRFRAYLQGGTTDRPPEPIAPAGKVLVAKRRVGRPGRFEQLYHSPHVASRASTAQHSS